MEHSNNGFGWGRDDSGDTGLSYQFTVTNGAVTAESVVWGNGHTHDVALTSAESFTVGTGAATETITSDSGTVTLDYTLESGSTTLYQVTGSSFTIANPTGAQPFGGTLTYDFTLTNGAVTGETETITFGHRTDTHTLNTPDDAVFTVGTSTVTESWVSGNHVKSLTYTALSGGGYAVSGGSSTDIAANGATTLLDVKSDRQALFTTDSGGAITAAEFVRHDGHTVSVSADSHIAFADLGSGYVEESFTWGNHSHFIVYYDGAGSGTYTDVAHGNGTTVDLVGLKAQIAELPTALQATV